MLTNKYFGVIVLDKEKLICTRLKMSHQKVFKSNENLSLRALSKIINDFGVVSHKWDIYSHPFLKAQKPSQKRG